MAKHLKRLDSRFHGNDKIVYILTFYEIISLHCDIFILQSLGFHNPIMMAEAKSSHLKI